MGCGLHLMSSDPGPGVCSRCYLRIKHGEVRSLFRERVEKVYYRCSFHLHAGCSIVTPYDQGCSENCSLVSHHAKLSSKKHNNEEEAMSLSIF